MAFDRIAEEHLLYDETVECNSHIILRKKLHSFIYPNRIHRDAMFAINGNLLLVFFSLSLCSFFFWANINLQLLLFAHSRLSLCVYSFVFSIKWWAILISFFFCCFGVLGKFVEKPVSSHCNFKFFFLLSCASQWTEEQKRKKGNIERNHFSVSAVVLPIAR